MCESRVNPTITTSARASTLSVRAEKLGTKEELETAVVDHEYQAVSVFAGGAPVDLAPCPSMDFTCSDGSCILKSSVCDGFDDCPRAEDELHCGILNTYVSCEAITTPGKI